MFSPKLLEVFANLSRKDSPSNSGWKCRKWMGGAFTYTMGGIGKGGESHKIPSHVQQKELPHPDPCPGVPCGDPILVCLLLEFLWGALLYVRGEIWSPAAQPVCPELS
jgi:hypothetical protein